MPNTKDLPDPEILKQIDVLTIKYFNLEDEIIKNQAILRKMEMDIKNLYNKSGSRNYLNQVKGFQMYEKITVSTSFNSKKFNAENPKKYQEYRFSQKRFNQKKLKEGDPELYNKYLETTESKSFIIEKLKRKKEAEPIEDEFI